MGAKKIILTEVKVDADILRTILSREILSNTTIIESGGYSSPLSIARTLLLDVAVTVKPFPDRNLHTGQVGTLAEILADEVYEVEFSDKSGRAITECAMKESDHLLLHYEALKAA